MNKMQNIEVLFRINLPDAVDPKKALLAVEDMFKNHRYPPNFAAVKGFSKHIVNRELGVRTLDLLARIPADKAKPTIPNIGLASAAALAAVLMSTIFSEPKSIAVELTTMIGDPQTKRVAVHTLYQGGDDVKINPDGPPRLYAPRHAASFVTDAEFTDTIALEPTDISGKEFLEKAWAFLEAAYEIKN